MVSQILAKAKTLDQFFLFVQAIELPGTCAGGRNPKFSWAPRFFFLNKKIQTKRSSVSATLERVIINFDCLEISL